LALFGSGGALAAVQSPKAQSDIATVLFELWPGCVKDTDKDHNTAAHGAVANDNALLLELLIKRGADVTARNALQRTPWHLARSCGS
jgi:ankyrin repeat protein